ncbi:hypothetical protein ACLOJK_041767 [Asimina triloba]
MVYSMGLFIDLIANTIVLAIKPCTLIRLLCLVGLKTVGVVTFTWLQLVKAVINFHVHLEILLQEMQLDLDRLMWIKKELEEQLQISLKEHQVIESILDEIEEEHDRAIARIDQLENERSNKEKGGNRRTPKVVNVESLKLLMFLQLQDLKDENSRLNKVYGKGNKSFTIQDDSDGKNVCDDDYNVTLAADYGASTWKSGHRGSEVIMNAWEDRTAGVCEKQVATRLYPFSTQVISRTLTVDDEALYRRRRVVLSQSLFSTILSMLVGMIIWKAEDSCMPLVVALFVVVGMSLKSVVQFFATIKSRPAADTVALISFNCFILGTLTSPTLPTVAHKLVPQALRLATWMIN